MSDGRIELHRRTIADRLAYLIARRAEIEAEGWTPQQLALVDQMIARARDDVAHAHLTVELGDEFRQIPGDHWWLTDGAERQVREEVAAGQLRIGNRHTWYASIRWSHQAWLVLHPTRDDRWK